MELQEEGGMWKCYKWELCGTAGSAKCVELQEV